jgi:hypothetical protein
MNAPRDEGMNDNTVPAWAKDLMTQILELRSDVQQTASIKTITASIETIDELRGALMARMDRLQAAVEARREDES